MFDKFTERSIRVVNAAQIEARRLDHNYVGTEQLLLGLIATRPSIAAQVLTDLDITLEEVQEQVQAVIGRGTGLSRTEIPFTPRSRRVLEQSLKEAERLGHSQVEPEHLLLAIVQDEAGLATQVLERLGVERVEVRIKVLQAISEAKPILKGKSSGRKSTPILNECGTNLTELAALGRLDPVVGRQQEVERMIQILGRRTKNNPILIGEPGVGKTALAEGLAQRIVDRDVPESLQNQQVLTLNIGTLLAGTKYRGEFEERLKTIMKEVRSSGNIILVIDEVHTLLGAGSAQGSLDAANILKPALARGELRCIGATTLDEYRQYVEQDAALERRFQPVMINEPSIEETILILQGLRSRYEQHHRLEISDLALEAAAKLADRYISDRLLPDKAIDLIDEAGSRARILHGKKFSLDKSMSERLKQILLTKASAIAQQDFKRAGEVRSSELTLQAEVQTEAPAFGSAIVVDEVDIAHIVSSWTGVPVNKVTELESEQLMQMEEVLHQRLIGQEEAVSAIARATRRARVGLSNPNRPIASFIFSGPTGVGKTELVKALAACFFGSESAMIRLDMSEFMERHTVSKLIGSPPGYVGYSEGGQLTEAVRRKPYTVVLFDEIEKAHPDVFNLLLQILEDGRLTDAKGRTVNFKNTLLVMTSNVGSKVIQKGGGGLGFELSTNAPEASYNRTVALVNEELKQYFRPEFLNRLDDIIVFRQLTHDEIKQIANLLLNEFSARLLEQGITLEVSDRVKDRLVETGYHPEQGARPLRRAITRLLEDSLAETILSGRVKSGDSVKVDLDEHGQIEIV
ncbi:MAG: ATP-dependent Clp protease ATP-binding subunit [Leptolyngbya sp. UWPOB_LEPTO1]|uniref:ATP-dependent Clp protease ATP-binding subunit n=1 Tax=Leptolyngbya sp. UWPOB_LEPTO1 TaxID=2815653 RepID=UPI001AC1D849|nr:ATP-dependent Clp protease ATP-binding subunit [Leptolyngbya sp. UWPOB_LEPTO1]MBN8562877.1 ATP-dependent Clp protease ATP-binding subunit [Leptolyngbya sp. UWPOB_LEPTO1]